MPCCGLFCGNRSTSSGGGSSSMQLLAAAEQDDVDTILQLCGSGGVLPDSVRDSEGCTPLARAARAGRAAAVEALLQHKASPHCTSYAAATPLLGASLGGHAQVVRLLLRAGANVAAADSRGETALHKIAHGWQRERARHYVEAARELLDARASPVAADAGGHTPLFVAGSLGITQLQELLRAAMQQGQGGSAGSSAGAGPASGARPHHTARPASTFTPERKPPASHPAAPPSGGPSTSGNRSSGGSSDDVGAQLLAAAERGDAATVEALLQANPTAASLSDAQGRTALHRIVQRWEQSKSDRYLACARALLATGASPVAASRDGQTPLFMAADLGISPLLEVMREALLSAQRSSSFRRRQQEEQEAQQAQQQQHQQQGQRQGQGQGHSQGGQQGGPTGGADRGPTQQLHEAARAGDAAALQRLLTDGGLSPNALDPETGLRPLHTAAAAGQAGAVRLLLASHADPDALNCDGEAPLHLAAQAGCSQSIRALLAAGASPNLKARDGNTALHLAVQSCDADAVWVLLAERASPHATNLESETALHCAAFAGKPAAVRALLAAGADVAATEQGGDTPLHCAVRGWKAEEGREFAAVVTALVKAEASPTAANRWGETPANLAVGPWEAQVLQLLGQQGRAGGVGGPEVAAPAAEEPTMCSVCLVNRLEVAFFPCAHFCACSDCTPLIMRPREGPPRCPICRAVVQQSRRIYVS